jgi:formylglycine-generating enzyme required for sulfatase activity
VVRGRSWNNRPRCLRSAFRGRDYPDNRNNAIGFRVARVGWRPA